MRSSLLSQVYMLARRAVVRTSRQPELIIPALTFPLMLLAVNAGGLDAAARLPGFPADSYLDFALTIAFMQGTLFAATGAGIDLARDIETGFLSRLRLTPMHPAALLAGQLAGVIVLALVQAAVFLSVGVLAGVEIKSGLLGVVVVAGFSALMALGFGTIGAFFALRTGSGEAVQGLFPLLFVGLFLSSMTFPRNLIETDWFRTVATYNPISYLVEGLRSLIITGWDTRALALGFAVAVALVVIGLTASSVALRGRMAS